MTVLPCPAISSTVGSLIVIPVSTRYPGLTTSTGVLLTLACAPLPGSALNSSVSASSRPRLLASSTTARAMGCSERDSTAAAITSKYSSLTSEDSNTMSDTCLLYTSDAADDLLCVDL